MHTTNDIRFPQNGMTAPRTISRRELAQRLLSGLAAGILSPLSPSAHPIHKHLLNGSLLDFADVHLAAGTAKPLFLSAQQLATLDVLSEAMVPGSGEAQAASFIDLLLSADTREDQQHFLASLLAFESASQSAFRADFMALDDTKRNELLTALSASDSTYNQHFNHLKNWISDAYYSSEAGMRELGWTPDRVFSTFPGCSHPEGHA